MIPRRLSPQLAVDFDFAVVIQLIRGVALAVEPHIAASRAPAGDYATARRLDIRTVRASAELRRIIVVVVEDRGDGALEVPVVGDLHHDIVINPRLRMEMPD